MNPKLTPEDMCAIIRYSWNTQAFLVEDVKQVLHWLFDTPESAPGGLKNRSVLFGKYPNDRSLEGEQRDVKAYLKAARKLFGWTKDNGQYDFGKSIFPKPDLAAPKPK